VDGGDVNAGGDLWGTIPVDGGDANTGGDLRGTISVDGGLTLTLTLWIVVM